jgi:drug/metabolite transporter (DMT)-like permease
MHSPRSANTTAVLQALFVTFLWSTSWVLVKIALADIPALTFAGLRYTIAFLILLPFAFGKQRIQKIRSLPFKTWGALISLGILFYSITQGTQFWALVYLPAATVSLLLNFTTVIVMVLSVLYLHENPSKTQIMGVVIFLAGVFAFFYPLNFSNTSMIGLVIASVSVLANGLSSVLGRFINRDSGLDAMTVTIVSMGSGSLILLVVGILVQGLPPLSLRNWGIVLWLAVVNSAFAFTLWNHTLRILPSTESSMINNTMLIQIALLAWVFLGETLNWGELLGLGLATVGIMIVQFVKSNASGSPSGDAQVTIPTD